MNQHTNLRLIAAQVIENVLNGRSMSDCLEKFVRTLNARDRAFVQALSFGVCRFYVRLDVLLSYFLKKPMKAKDMDVYALLLVGLYQIGHMRTPQHAAVKETVDAVGLLKKSWARGFVNAILREYVRQQGHFDEKCQHDEEASFAHSSWWIDKIKEAWPNHWVAILNANNQHPPFALRVNCLVSSREQYANKLTALDCAYRHIEFVDQGIILDKALSKEEIPGLLTGEVSVQDGAAQLAAPLLKLKPHTRVLDACAAPGGKLTHLYEAEPDLAEIYAVEKDNKRLGLIKENIARLNLKSQQVHLLNHDANNLEAWWNGKLFDSILLDAPCSASGVIRRHPDIKLLRQPEDIATLADLQYELLSTLWQTLKPGGIMLYATCSIFPEENANVILKFLANEPTAIEDMLHEEWGVACEVGRQILPGMHEMDGFYYARLKKISSDKNI